MSLEHIPLADLQALATGPAYQAPVVPAADKLARVGQHLVEPGITPMREAALQAWAERLTALAAEEAEYADFPSDDEHYPPMGAEELAHLCAHQSGPAYHD